MLESEHTGIRRRAAGDTSGLAGIPPLLARLYAARGVRSAAELALGLEHLLPFGRLANIDAASALLAEALVSRQRILIVGDYDCDGATATAVGVLGLRRLGAAQVECLIPDRRRHGYGLTPAIVALALAREPALIITVDNGIASIEGVAAARQAGVRVLITDHHLPGAVLPAADAIVDPNLPGDDFPSKALAGVGVMFYVLLALRARLREQGWFGPARPEPNLAELLDLVALGTVADVAVLDRNNRILVHQGLLRLRAGRGRPGLLALAEVAGRRPAELSAQDLGFALGPRLNAAGRLADMQRGVDLLLSDDPQVVRGIAAELDALNRERRAVEADMQEDALALVAGLGGGLPSGLCLHDPGWHAGVVGLVASRLKERLHRPVIAFATGEDGLLKGSARSIPGLHVRDCIEAVATSAPGLVERFGGHAMAAGLSIAPDRLADFSAAFAAEVAARVDPADLAGVVWTDGELPADSLHAATARLLHGAGPWGQGFPEPVFDGEFAVRGARLVGGRHLKLSLQAPGVHQPLAAIRFGWDGELPQPGTRLRLAYQLQVDDWQGGDAAQLLVQRLGQA